MFGGEGGVIGEGILYLKQICEGSHNGFDFNCLEIKIKIQHFTTADLELGQRVSMR